jgi:hypothetical protein
MDEVIHAEDLPQEVFSRILEWFSGDVIQLGILQQV